MILRNPLTKARADLLYAAKGFTRNDGFDNTTDYIVLGAIATYQAVSIQYAIVLPVSGRSQTGRIEISHDGITATMNSHGFNYTAPEITGLTFGTDINAGNVRLVLTKTGVGENPTLFYRVDQYPVA